MDGRRFPSAQPPGNIQVHPSGVEKGVGKLNPKGLKP